LIIRWRRRVSNRASAIFKERSKNPLHDHGHVFSAGIPAIPIAMFCEASGTAAEDMRTKIYLVTQLWKIAGSTYRGRSQERDRLLLKQAIDFLERCFHGHPNNLPAPFSSKSLMGDQDDSNHFELKHFLKNDRLRKVSNAKSLFSILTSSILEVDGFRQLQSIPPGPFD
jgi:hypothetical protein